MIIQDIYLEKYDWYARIYYSIDKDDSDQILEDIVDLGCSKEEFEEIKNFLYNIKKDTGITYSNPDTRFSVIAMSESSCAMEFQSTIDHEKGHLASHISIKNEIYPFGEEYQYLIGSISRKTFPVAKLFLCDNCRRG